MDQLDHLTWLMGQRHIKVKAVIVSIGGNDALFGEIGQACIAPGDCTEIGDRWLKNLDKAKKSIYAAYQSIRASVGDDIPIIVVPYPVPLREHGCAGSVLTENEHKFLVGYTGALNNVLKDAAHDAGLYYLGEMATVLQENNLRICDDSAGKVGVNFFGLNAVDGLIEESVNPLNWFHNSLHPNARGHRVMSETLVRWLERHPDLKPQPDTAPDNGPPGTPTIEKIMGDPNFPYCGRPHSGLAHCEDSTGEWTLAQIVTFLQRGTAPLLMVVAGAWVLWLLYILWWRRSVHPSLERASTRRLPWAIT